MREALGPNITAKMAKDIQSEETHRLQSLHKSKSIQQAVQKWMHDRQNKHASLLGVSQLPSNTTAPGDLENMVEVNGKGSSNVKANTSQWSYEDAAKNHTLVEGLAYELGTDKSKDDHNYVALYSMLFDARRLSIQNVTEVGIATGQSLKMWHEYFPHATIHGIDIENVSILNTVMAPFERVKLHRASSQVVGVSEYLGLAPESMDLVIDDGDHTWSGQERTLANMWRLVKPGGFYMIEDVQWDGAPLDRRSYRMIHHPNFMPQFMQDIFTNNDAMFVDTTLGHRAWKDYIQYLGAGFAVDHFSHNSHMLIIRKRAEPLRPVHINSEHEFMYWPEPVNWGRWEYLYHKFGANKTAQVAKSVTARYQAQEARKKEAAVAAAAAATESQTLSIDATGEVASEK